MKKKVSLVCTKCGSRNYATIKSAEAKKIRLEINKFCKKCNAHTLHQEAK
ncbi:MAG TPA: 50S ribosomal protein L33 [Massilibacterium sp.]|nr:50S ribosomal protein L33 [Massilibacterium sp.]